MPKVKNRRHRPLPDLSLEYSRFLKSNRAGRRNAVSNILDEPQVAINLPILTLPAELSELKVTDEAVVNMTSDSRSEIKSFSEDKAE